MDGEEPLRRRSTGNAAEGYGATSARRGSGRNPRKASAGGPSPPKRSPSCGKGRERILVYGWARQGGQEVIEMRDSSGEVIEYRDAATQAADEASPGKKKADSGLSCDPMSPSFLIPSSVWINAVLFLIKVVVFVMSGSLAVLASVVDSAIDLLAQSVLWWAKTQVVGGATKEYPVGRSQLEPVGVVICAVVMGMASIEVIRASTVKIVENADSADGPPIHLSLSTWAMLCGVIVLKAVLWLWSLRVLQLTHDESVAAITQDNLNDVLSNASALVALLITMLGGYFWLADPVAGILISVYIIWNWIVTALEQVEHIVGKTADDEFLQEVKDLAGEHGQECGMQLDSMQAYHFGPKYLVELEMIMAEETVLRESHDAGMQLQHTIESQFSEKCFRCFVHIDYDTRIDTQTGRSYDHDVNVPLEQKLCKKPGRPPVLTQVASGTKRTASLGRGGGAASPPSPSSPAR